MRVYMLPGFLKHFLILFVLLSLGADKASAQSADTKKPQQVSKPQAGSLVGYSVIKNFPQPELQAFFKQQHIPAIMLGVKQGITIYEILYTTTYADGSPVKASGMLYVPQEANTPAPTMIYNHGTEICRESCFDGTGEQSICLAFATDGYIVICPDYIGKGKGEREQLYLDAKTEAGASVDMLIATDGLLPELHVTRGPQLFVTGYSQGGHAAMATHRLLQEKYADRFPVTASSPMSGPYDVESTVYASRKKHYDYPGYLPFMLATYYETQGGMANMKDALVAPYDTILPALVNGGEWPMEVIDAHMPDTAFKAVKKEFYLDFEQNANSPFRKYLASNNVYDWKPEAPVQ
ncbi:MAG: hypothetical protein JWO03_1989, partial [Bacteroidetes bacterium]|nr:hypothetical protein [Bacteroidota bacterium]